MRRSVQKAKVCKAKAVRRGSITVFASLSLLLVSSFLLALLEAARVQGLEAYSRMHRVNAMESVFSEYQRDLFEKYGVFLLDGGYGTETMQLSQINSRLQSVSQKNLRPAFPGQFWRSVQNFYQMDVTDASVSGYLLATDYEGAPFRHMAAESMKMRFPAEMAKKLHDGLQSAGSAMDQAQQSQSMMDTAQENIRAAKEEQARAAAERAAAGEPVDMHAADEAEAENPMDIVKATKKKDILSLVLPPGSSISSKDIRNKTTLEHRTLSQGNEPWNRTGDWYETILYHQFLQTQFACFEAGMSGDGGLDYELEYIQAGKQSDRENLRSVVNTLLVLREGANFLYLQTDAVKCQEARALALSIAAAVGIAPAAELIAQGILAAWAFAESVLDVRTLLAGGRIPWIKTTESWTSSLSGIGSLLSGSARAKEQESGEDYRGYLQKLLYLKPARTLNYRAMDLMEMYAARCGNEHLRMDAVILSMRADFSYVAEPLFSDLVTLQKPEVDDFEFAETEEYSYFTPK